MTQNQSLGSCFQSGQASSSFFASRNKKITMAATKVANPINANMNFKNISMPQS